MKKVLGAIIAAIAFTLGIASTATAAEVNFGQCHHNLDNPQWQAPGQSGNGPLTIVNGKHLVPEAYAGGQGCTKMT